MTTAPTDVLRSDPVFATVVDEYGPLTLEPAEDTFQRLVISVLRQQVSMESAAATRERLFDSVDVTPDGILTADETTLQAAGLSTAKTEYVKAIARAYQEHAYNHAFFAGMSNEAVAEELTEIHGVGPWTAKMFLLFALGREDVFAVEDLGIRNGMWELYGDELTRGEMKSIAQAWRPYRSYASLYLWRVSD